MAYQDTLFQLGMDLTRSSTAQKEDHCVVASAAHEEPNEAREAGGNRQEGRNLFIDLHGSVRLADAKSVERALKSGLDKLGKVSASVAVRRLADGTLSGACSLKSGQLSIRANPKTGYVAIDVIGCSGLDPHAAMFALADAFSAREAAIQTARCSDAVFLPAVKPAAKTRASRTGKVARAA